MISGKSLTGCGGCDSDVEGIGQNIQEACKFMINGHVGVSELYKVLAERAKDAETRSVFLGQAEKHDRMARETSEVTLPEGGGAHDSTQSAESGGRGSAVV